MRWQLLDCKQQALEEPPIDVATSQRSKHPAGHTGMRAHTDTYDRNLSYARRTANLSGAQIATGLLQDL